jgi:hypothetical protein
MRSLRFSIAGLMGAVLIAALGLVALRSASETWAGLTLLATCGVLGLAVVGVVCRGAAERAWWLGFAIFGWGYIVLAFWSPANGANLPTMIALEATCTKIGMTVPTKPPAPRIGMSINKIRAAPGTTGDIDPSFTEIGQCLWALVGAYLGGVLASSLFFAPAFRSEEAASDTQTTSLKPQRWTRRPLVVGLAGLALAATVAVLGSVLDSQIWAGLSFFLTSGLLGVVTLAAILRTGSAREIWLGAALFGWGYMTLAFGWHPFHLKCPYLVTSRLLNAIRPSFPPEMSGFPPCDDRTDPANIRILKLLEQPVPMHFPAATPLDEVLAYIRSANVDSDGKPIPVYVDPIGLQEAEKSMSSKVSLNFEGVPLKSSLAYLLKQLELTYCVKSGFLQIISDSEEEAELMPRFENPFLIVGHSLLALLAAGLGGLVAPIVAGQKRV